MNKFRPHRSLRFKAGNHDKFRNSRYPVGGLSSELNSNAEH